MPQGRQKTRGIPFFWSRYLTEALKKFIKFSIVVDTSFHRQYKIPQVHCFLKEMPIKKVL
jgi:hypothetical protein